MSDLIEALKIFLKYENSKWPTNCSHDVLAIMDINPEIVTDVDKLKLEALGFIVNDDYDGFISFRFGSA